MRQENSVRSRLVRIAAGDNIDQHPALPDSRSKVAVIRAASVGDMMPGRTATRNFSRLVLGINVRRRYPRIFAGVAGGQQYRAVTQFIDRLGNLPQIRIVGQPRAMGWIRGSGRLP